MQYSRDQLIEWVAHTLAVAEGIYSASRKSLSWKEH